MHISAGQEVLYAAREAGGLPGSAEKHMIRAPFLFLSSRLQTCILSYSDLNKILNTLRKLISSKNKCGKGSDPVAKTPFLLQRTEFKISTLLDIYTAVCSLYLLAFFLFVSARRKMNTEILAA